MTENRVNPQNFYVVQGWMVSELGLKGNELAVYAIIYGFSQAEQQCFRGSLQYLASWTNCSREGIRKIMKSLVNKQLITRNEVMIQGVKFLEWYPTKLVDTPQLSWHTPPIKLADTPNKVGISPQQSCPNNIRDNISDNITDKTDSTSALSEKRIAYTFCEAFGADSMSERLLKTIRATLQAGVSQERIEALIRSAAGKHPREPESYIAAGLKKLQAAPEQKRVRFKPEEKPLDDWEAEWKREFEAMQQDMQA